jgi:tetratricopeptide (TPR) repeat protein
MAQAKIYWDAGNYAAIEKLFRRSVEFCNENETWKLNVAHVLFMQEAKYKEAISFYEPIVKRNYEKVSIKYLHFNDESQFISRFVKDFRRHCNSFGQSLR